MWSFLARLRERKLAHWAIAYLAGAWLILQVLDLLAQPFAWPTLVVKAATVLLAIGFFAMLVLAWYHGEKGVQRVSGVEVLMLAGILVIAGAAVAFVGGGRRGGASLASSPDSTASSHERTAIAVLPFDNLAAGGPYAYFAVGLHEALVTQLAKVAALTKVIGRTSVMTYEGSAKRLGQIGDELGVGSLVEGSVQVVGDRLRVNVQLVDPVTEGHLWAEQYDRDLDDVLAVESDIAEQIVAAVGATLGAGERAAIATAPTADPEAYRLYLQGREYYLRPGDVRRNMEIAQNFFEQAVDRDSTFALAFAALAEAHGSMSNFRWDPSPQRFTRLRQAAELALRLAPNLPQAHMAMGRVHYVRNDVHAALREYQVALQALPNDAEVWLRIGFAHRRLGNWDQAFAARDTTVRIDPRNVDAIADLGANTLARLHRYEEAIQWNNSALALAPDDYRSDWQRGQVWVLWKGRVDSLGAALARHPDAGPEEMGWRLRYTLWTRQPDTIYALLRRMGRGTIESPTLYVPTALCAAWAHRLRGDLTAARLAFDSALNVLDSAVVALPDDWRRHASRGLVLAGLGRKREAQAEAQWLQRSREYRESPYLRSDYAEHRAMILAGSGDLEAALDEIQRLLVESSAVSVHTLRLDPRWDPIRNDPRFQALLVKYANPQPVH